MKTAIDAVLQHGVLVDEGVVGWVLCGEVPQLPEAGLSHQSGGKVLSETPG